MLVFWIQFHFYMASNYCKSLQEYPWGTKQKPNKTELKNLSADWGYKPYETKNFIKWSVNDCGESIKASFQPT